MECVLIVFGVLIFIIISAASEQTRRRQAVNRDFRVYNQNAPKSVLVRELGSERFRNLQRAFQQVSSELGGELVPGAVPGHPRVVLTHRGTRVMLSMQDTRTAPTRLREETARFYTRLTFKIPPGWIHRLEIFPQTEKTDARYLKMFDISIGDADFDPRYVIKSSDPEFAKDFLDRPTRKAVDDLNALPPFVSIILSLNRERLILSKPGVMDEPRLLRRYVEAAFRFYARIGEILDRVSGLVVVAAGSGDEQPICNVCGAEIDPAKRVVCRRCETPLHEDCWKYNGKCAVFGCGEDRYR